MQNRLMGTRMVFDLNLIVTIAESVALDGQPLVADIQTPEIEMALDKARAIASMFGFYETPPIAIGSTVFLGAIPTATVRQIMQAEVDLPRRGCALTVSLRRGPSLPD